jgi:hypothetical protein
MKAFRVEDDKSPLIKVWMEQNVLNQLDNTETRVKQLNELFSKSDDRRIVSKRIIDRVGDFIWDTNKEARIAAVNTYAALLGNNPELANKKRVNRFLELSEEKDVEIKKLFLRRLCIYIEGFEVINPDVRGMIFRCLNDQDAGVREEATKTIDCKFNISEEVIKKLFNAIGKLDEEQRLDALGRVGALSYRIEVSCLWEPTEVNIVFSHLAKVAGEIGKDNYADFKFAIQSAKNFVLTRGDAEHCGECIELNYRLYKEIKERVGSDWDILGKVFTVWIPELAKEVGSERLADGLREMISEVRRGKEFYESDLIGIMRKIVADA